MNAPTGSQSNIVLKPQDVEPVDISVPEGRMSMTQPSTSFQPHLVPEGFVRIGLVPLRESQLPVTPVGILAVRGEGGRG